MKEKLRPLALMLAVSFLVPLGELVILRRPVGPFEIYNLIDGLLITYAIYWWYFLDRRDRKFRTGTFQNIGVVLLPIVALPIYFIRSRGWLKGMGTSALAFVALFAIGGLNILGEKGEAHCVLTTRWSGP